MHVFVHYKYDVARQWFSSLRRGFGSERNGVVRFASSHDAPKTLWTPVCHVLKKEQVAF